MKNNSSNMSSLLVGMAIGATAVALVHEPTRKKVAKKMREVMDQGDQKMDQLTDKANAVKGKAKKKVANELQRAQKRLEHL